MRSESVAGFASSVPVRVVASRTHHVCPRRRRLVLASDAGEENGLSHHLHLNGFDHGLTAASGGLRGLFAFVSAKDAVEIPERYAKVLAPKLAYLDAENQKKVLSALGVADRAHSGQMRKSGDPFIIHPVAVAEILAEMQMDRDTVIAGLLHDTVEDTPMTLEELEVMFGKDVRKIVEGETKLSKLASKVHNAPVEKPDDRVCHVPELTELERVALEEERKREEKAWQQADNLRGMFLAMTEDVRVIIVKLADRLHNMRTLEFMSLEKQKKISKETLDIFAPLAHRLGMFRIKTELEDLSFKFLYPTEYQSLREELDDMRRHPSSLEKLERARQTLKDLLESDPILKPIIREIKVEVKERELYQIFKKKRKRKGTENAFLDTISFLITTDLIRVSNDDGTRFVALQKNVCYHILGRVHSLWKPLPRRVKDYIANPKPNGYQSLHTSVLLGPDLDFSPWKCRY